MLEIEGREDWEDGEDGEKREGEKMREHMAQETRERGRRRKGRDNVGGLSSKGYPKRPFARKEPETSSRRCQYVLVGASMYWWGVSGGFPIFVENRNKQIYGPLVFERANSEE